MRVLYESLQRRQYAQYKFHAALQGVNLDDEKGAPKTDKPTEPPRKLPMFGHPRDYAHLSPEERQRLTEEMMAAHKGMVAETGLLQR